MAYENLAKRTDLDGVKSVCIALHQAERYGTPLGPGAARHGQENRDMRMAEAEKKAAALPPKLTVPMILFFLPVLFVVILGPAAIRVMAIAGHRASTPLRRRRAAKSQPDSRRRFYDPRRRRQRRAALAASSRRSAAPASAADRRRWRRPRRATDRRARCVSASWKRPCRPTTSARFCRTFGSAPGCAAARRSVASACGRFFDSA